MIDKLYCSHNDGNEAYSQIKGTLYCKGHIAQLEAARNEAWNKIPDPSEANYSLEPSVDLRNEIKKGHEPIDNNPFRFEEEQEKQSRDYVGDFLLLIFYAGAIGFILWGLIICISNK